MYLPVATAALLLTTLSSAAPAASTDAPEGDASRFQYYQFPTLEGPCDMCTGPDGAIWVQDLFVNKIGRIDPATGALEEYAIPYPLEGTANVTSGCAIQPGADGNLYATAGLRNKLIQINPTTKAMKVFTPEPLAILGNLQPLNDLWTGTNGMYFSQTTANLLSFFDFKTEKITNYPLPTPLSMPVGMRTGPEGDMWVVESSGNKIARFDTTAMKFIAEYKMPEGALLPAVMRAITSDEYLYFTCTLSNQIGQISTKTGEIKLFTNPTPLTAPIEDTNDCNGNVWYSSATQNTLIYLTPSTGKFTTIKQPGAIVYTPLSLPPAVDIAVHYGPLNSIWFTELAGGKVGRYQLSGNEGKE